MTEQKAIEAVVTTANSQVGYREGENNYNKFAAELDPLGLTYGPKQNAPWCAEFDLWVFVKCFGADKALEMLCSPKPSAIPLCKSGAQYFKNAGRWSDKPSLGAIVFFVVSGDINHQGIVTNVSGSFLTVVEGNSSDMVSRRTYRHNDASISGYGVPKWSVVADKPAEKPAEQTQVQTPPVSVPVSATKADFSLEFHTLRYGAGMGAQAALREEVRSVQRMLKSLGFDVGRSGLDGEFGIDTRNAVCSYQRSVRLPADGIVGPKTRAALNGLSV